MTELEDQVWRELEGQLCDVPLHLLDFATRQGIVDRLAPRVAAALEAARAEGYEHGRMDVETQSYVLPGPPKAGLAALRGAEPPEGAPQ